MSWSWEAKARFHCRGCRSSWIVEGRWNADGEFEPTLEEEVDCEECGVRAAPEPEVALAW